MLLEAVGATHSDAVVPLLADYLHGSDSDLWDWAIWALMEIDTKESRRVRWEARSYVFETDQETEYFRKCLAEAIAGHSKGA